MGYWVKKKWPFTLGFNEWLEHTKWRRVKKKRILKKLFFRRYAVKDFSGLFDSVFGQSLEEAIRNYNPSDMGIFKPNRRTIEWIT